MQNFYIRMRMRTTENSIINNSSIRHLNLLVWDTSGSLVVFLLSRFLPLTLAYIPKENLWVPDFPRGLNGREAEHRGKPAFTSADSLRSWYFVCPGNYFNSFISGWTSSFLLPASICLISGLLQRFYLSPLLFSLSTSHPLPKCNFCQTCSSYSSRNFPSMLPHFFLLSLPPRREFP